MLRTPSRVAFIDDDKDFVEVLAFGVPTALGATFHSKPETVDRVLAATAQMLHREQELLARIAAVQQDGRENVVELALQFFANPERFDITSVLVADQAMPIEDGISLCGRHNYPGLRRILLTGYPDASKAVAAFNAQSIDMFVPKQSSRPLQSIIDGVHLQMNESAARRGELLRPALDPDINDALALAPVQETLQSLLKELGVVEYMALGAPQGLIAITGEGRALWVQIEDDASTESMVEGLVDTGWPSVELEQVRRHEMMVNSDVMSHLGQHPTSAPTQVLSGAPYVGAAVFELDGLPPHLQPLARNAWLALQGNKPPAIAS